MDHELYPQMASQLRHLKALKVFREEPSSSRQGHTISRDGHMQQEHKAYVDN